MSTIINPGQSGPVNTTRADYRSSVAKALYDAGVKLYTKNAMRRVAKELKLCEEALSHGSEKCVAILPGIDGFDHRSTVDLVPPLLEPPHKLIPGTSMCVILYQAIERLTYDGDDSYLRPTDPYLSMDIDMLTRFTLDEDDKDDEPDKKDLHVSSVDGLCGAFSAIEREWGKSKYYERLQAALDAARPPVILDKVVGVALGSLCTETNVHYRSIHQHALISAIYSILLQRSEVSAPCKRYVQDVAYTQRDKDVLSFQGLTILDDPGAFLTLDDSSVLVSIAPVVPVKQIVADTCRPGIIIWTKPVEVKKMLENDYCQLDFPHHEDIGDVVMYVRKGA
ncbi:hypothetical protein RRF57_004343 [Xylaria bambusicola]|uniref:SRR1-like domain-containing protein n=1 Tax=Xylaria bambusicola TaxID=326684 RepID=A0AAN7Z6D5_9PEZI